MLGSAWLPQPAPPLQGRWRNNTHRERCSGSPAQIQAAASGIKPGPLLRGDGRRPYYSMHHSAEGPEELPRVWNPTRLVTLRDVQRAWCFSASLSLCGLQPRRKLPVPLVFPFTSSLCCVSPEASWDDFPDPSLPPSSHGREARGKDRGLSGSASPSCLPSSEAWTLAFALTARDPFHLSDGNLGF